MSEKARDVAETRAVRDLARANFETRLELVKADLEARGLGGRIAGSIGAKAKEGLDEALAIADSNRGVIAATIAALALWLLRNPITAWLGVMLGPRTDNEEFDDDREEENAAQDRYAQG